MQFEGLEGARGDAAAACAVSEVVSADVVVACGVIVGPVAGDREGGAIKERVGGDVVRGFGPVPVWLVGRMFVSDEG